MMLTGFDESAAGCTSPLAAPYSALSLVNSLAKMLKQACKEAVVQSPWRVPQLFFFNNPDSPITNLHQARNQRSLPETPIADLVKSVTTLARRLPRLRAMLRAKPGLTKRIEFLARICPACAELSRLLALVDNEVVVVLHPKSRRGWRMSVQGIATIGQFQQHFAERVASQPRAVLSALGPITRWLWLHPDTLAATNNFAQDCGHWLLDTMTLPKRTNRQGERVLVLSEAVFDRKRFPTSGRETYAARILNFRELSELELERHFGRVMHKSAARQAA